MARTKKGSKYPGFEFWGTRPMTYCSGTWAKRYCHRIERRDNKTLVKRELNLLE